MRRERKIHVFPWWMVVASFQGRSKSRSVAGELVRVETLVPVAQLYRVTCKRCLAFCRAKR